MIVERHGHRFVFPEVPNASEVPWTYRPFGAGRWYEEPFLEHIRRQGRRGVYVDVGAHLGTHTAWFATLCPSTHVHAVEPVDRFADQIQRVLEANSLEGKVTVHRVGLSDQPGQASNLLSRHHRMGFDPVGAAAERVETFPVATLDDLVGGSVAVIKLDVEGMEPRVLAGARRLLREHRPVVYAEASNHARLHEVSAVLKHEGYSLTGRVFNSSATYEFVPATASLPLVVFARRGAYTGKRIAHALWWRLRRSSNGVRSRTAG